MLSSLYTHKQHYNFITKYELIAKFPIKNVMEIPKLEKIDLNFGLIKTLQNKKQIIPALLALKLVSEQKPQPTKSKKQLYSYKIRKNMIVGANVTLRKKKMFSFLEKFVVKALPNYQNFLGFEVNAKQSDRAITICLKDLNIFPELEKHHHLFNSLTNLNITFVFKESNSLKLNNNTLFYIFHSLRIPLIKKVSKLK